MSVKNDTQGLGIDLFNNTALYGSSGRLQGTIDMGNLSVVTTNPLDPKFEDTLYRLSHELMHRWGVYVKFKNPDGSLAQRINTSYPNLIHWDSSSLMFLMMSFTACWALP
jgi:hypothetical protein